MVEPKWLSEPEQHDYPAAASYLALIYSANRVIELVAKLQAATVMKFKAKDIFRASELPLLGMGNSHVEKNRKKIKEGKALSPILLVREEAHRKVIVADGYHRLVAIYEANEDSEIPCKIV